MFNVSDQLREAIVGSSNSMQNIAKMADVNRPDFERFLQEGETISSDEFDRLCKVLELNLVPEVAKVNLVILPHINPKV
jgi:hypothetical protein